LSKRQDGEQAQEYQGKLSHDIPYLRTRLA
jgi:hypothetical protein